MLKPSALQLITRDCIDKIFNVHFKGHGRRHGLVSKTASLSLKQDYNSMRSNR